MSLPCGGLAGQRTELKMFEVQTNLEAKLYLFFSKHTFLHVCRCIAYTHFVWRV